MKYSLLSQINKLNPDKFSKKAPIIKVLLFGAIFCQGISLLTEAFGMHTFFEQFIDNYAGSKAISNLIHLAVMLLLLFIGTFFFGLLKVKSYSTKNKAIFFIAVFAICAWVVYMVDFDASLVGGSIGVVIATLMELLIRALTIYICWEVCTFTWDASVGENLGDLLSILVASFILYQVANFSIFTSKKATHHAFWAQKPETEQADLSDIKNELSQTKATNLSDYNLKKSQAEEIARNKTKIIEEAYAATLSDYDDDIQYWQDKRTPEGKKYKYKVKTLKDERSEAEKKMYAEIRPIEEELATTLSQLLNEYDTANKNAQKDYSQKKTQREEDALSGTGDTTAYFTDMSWILATMGGYSVTLSIFFYIMVVLNLRLMGVKPFIEPSKEFFEGNIGGFFRELWQFILLKTVRDLRNAIRNELGNLTDLKPIKSTSTLFPDWDRYKSQTKSVKDSKVNKSGRNTSGTKKETVENKAVEDSTTVENGTVENSTLSTNGTVEDSTSVENSTVENCRNETVENSTEDCRNGQNPVGTLSTELSTTVENGTVENKNVENSTLSTTVENGTVENSTTVINEVKVVEGMPSVFYKGTQRDEAWIRKQIKTYEGFLGKSGRNPETVKKNIDVFNNLLIDIELQKKGEFLTD